MNAKKKLKWECGAFYVETAERSGRHCYFVHYREEFGKYVCLKATSWDYKTAETALEAGKSWLMGMMSEGWKQIEEGEK